MYSILDILNLKSHSEQVESILIQNFRFSMELGKGFSFVGRQYRISSETEHYYIDLVFIIIS
jgi:predicted nuclease of restriction endonuclease-like (RecB) superfamily